MQVYEEKLFPKKKPRVCFLGMLFLIATFMAGCTGAGEDLWNQSIDVGASQSKSQDAETESASEPVYEKTSWDIFLEAREKQGITEEDVQETLKELREGNFLYFNLLNEDEQYVYAEEYIIATRFVTPDNWENDYRKSDTFFLWDTSEAIGEDNLARVGLAFEWDQLELVYTNYLYKRGLNPKKGLTCYVRWTSKHMADGNSWEKSKKVYEAELLTMRNTADEILKDLPDGDDYTKAKYIMEAICKRYTYREDGPRHLYDIFRENETQCEGYAKTFAYLAHRAGIEVGYMEGYPNSKLVSENEKPGHAWNIAKLDGEYYYIDCTWADDNKTNSILYYYLGMTDEQFAQSGYVEGYPYAMTIKKMYGQMVNPQEFLGVPKCTATADSFMYREGVIIEEYSKDALKAAVKDKKCVILCFPDSEVGKKSYEYLIEKKNLLKIWENGYTYNCPKEYSFIYLEKMK